MATGLEVDRTAIGARARHLSRHDSPSVDLWVILPGFERHESADVVRSALQGQEDVELVYPTSGGTYVFVSEGTAWSHVVDVLEVAMAERGISGSVTAPSELDLERLEPPAPALTALMGAPIDPPQWAGPINDWGMPEYRWGVSSLATERLLRPAIAWAAAIGPTGQVGGAGPYIPATAEDAAEVAALRLATGQQHVRVTFAGPERTARVIDLHTFGQLSLTHATDGPGVQLAEEMARLLRANAELLDFGAVRPMQPLSTGALALPVVGLWLWHRHLWASRVFDVHGIQLLTSQHLQHARDLSDWHVEEVAPSRFLVSARDLHPWFAVTDYVEWEGVQARLPEFLVSARRDFGDMILTEEIATAHPR